MFSFLFGTADRIEKNTETFKFAMQSYWTNNHNS